MIIFYDRLGPRFFGVDLEYGKMELHPGHTVTCFMIVEILNDEKYIRKQALKLLMTGRDRLFHIYGKQKQLWLRIMNETEGLLHPNAELAAMMVVNAGFDHFVDELKSCIHARLLIPNDVYLLYDDPAVYQKVLQKLGLQHKLFILSREPLPGMTAEELLDAWNECNDTGGMVSLYASVHNQIGWVADDIDDFYPESEKYKETCRFYRSWCELEKTMRDQLTARALKEGLPLPEGKGLMKKLEPLMQKYGFINGNGWWIARREG